MLEKSLKKNNKLSLNNNRIIIQYSVFFKGSVCENWEGVQADPELN